MKLGDRWRVVIEKNHREELKRREAAVARQQVAFEQGTATALPQEAITK